METDQARGPAFSSLMARVDETALEAFVGVPAVRLLNLLEPSLARPSRLRDVCLALHAPEDLLRGREHRRHLINALSREDARKLADALGMSDAEQPYPALHAANFQRNSPAERTLFSFLGVVPAPSERHQPPETGPTSTPTYALFPHQRRAYRRVLDHLDSANPRVVLHMPTGAGKTRTALHAIAATLRRAEPGIVVWLAYSEELCAQAASEFEKAWAVLGDRDVTLYRYWGGADRLDIADVHDGFMVAGLAKMFERARVDADFITRLADRTTLVIIDEAHQAIAQTYSFVLDYLVQRQERTGLLGLTATPGRTWSDVEQDQELADFFARQKVTLEVEGFDTPVDYLVSEGYLATPHFRSIRYTADEALTPHQRQQLASALDVPEPILSRLADDEQRNLLVIQEVEELLQHHSRVLVFAATVGHARLLATVLSARGHDAAAVTGDTATDERNRVINRFRNNDPEARVLTNYGVLTAGFDAPKTSAVVIARPTKSLVLHSQMIGRALRGPKAQGTESAEIVTVVDTQLPGFGDMSEAFANWEDVWHD